MERLLFASYLGAQMTAMKGLDGGIDRWHELQRKIGSNSFETESERQGGAPHHHHWRSQGQLWLQEG